MKPIVCLLVLTLSLGAAHLALAQSGAPARTARVQPALVVVLGADMGASCKDGDTERARKLAEACNDKQQCSFTPDMGDAASEACARDSKVLWNCDDGLTRYVALAPAMGQSREIHLECPQNKVATAAPEPKNGTETVKAEDAKLASAPKDATETVKVDELRLPTVTVTARARPPALDASARGIAQEQVRMVCEAFYDPTGPEVPGQRLAQLHNDLWKAPDHSPNAVGAARQCGPKTAIPDATALPQ